MPLRAQWEAEAWAVALAKAADSEASNTQVDGIHWPLSPDAARHEREARGTAPHTHTIRAALHPPRASRHRLQLRLKASSPLFYVLRTGWGSCKRLGGGLLASCRWFVQGPGVVTEATDGSGRAVNIPH